MQLSFQPQQTTSLNRLAASQRQHADVSMVFSGRRKAAPSASTSWVAPSCRWQFTPRLEDIQLTSLDGRTNFKVPLLQQNQRLEDLHQEKRSNRLFISVDSRRDDILVARREVLRNCWPRFNPDLIERMRRYIKPKGDPSKPNGYIHLNARRLVSQLGFEPVSRLLSHLHQHLSDKDAHGNMPESRPPELVSHGLIHRHGNGENAFMIGTFGWPLLQRDWHIPIIRNIRTPRIEDGQILIASPKRYFDPKKPVSRVFIMHDNAFEHGTIRAPGQRPKNKKDEAGEDDSTWIQNFTRQRLNFDTGIRMIAPYDDDQIDTVNRYFSDPNNPYKEMLSPVTALIWRRPRHLTKS